jgi:L-ascorbate metabolism protein UlaG (beta-lactamase superfamily)
MVFAFFLLAAVLQSGKEKNGIEKDVITTPSGAITISFIGHGSLMFEFNGKVIHVDPWSQLADYSHFPKADIILVTHHHFDHLDEKAIGMLLKSGTQIVLTHDAYNVLKKGTVMRNGETKTIGGITIDAVPAYNSTKGREQFHPRGRDNGYILTLGGKRIYIAGDTEDIPEMDSLKNIDIAFLPMNQPYTMLPEQVVNAVHMFHPKILYPYHYGETDVSEIQKLMSKETGTEVRIRSMK